MVERVYGQMPPVALHQALAAHLEGDLDTDPQDTETVDDTSEACTTFAPNLGAEHGSNGHHGQPNPDPQNEKTPKTKGFQGQLSVPRDRIELPTRGFSSLRWRAQARGRTSGCGCCGGEV
jgi:hypothetical protein